MLSNLDFHGIDTHNSIDNFNWAATRPLPDMDRVDGIFVPGVNWQVVKHILNSIWKEICWENQDLKQRKQRKAARFQTRKRAVLYDFGYSLDDKDDDQDGKKG